MGPIIQTRWLPKTTWLLCSKSRASMSRMHRTALAGIEAELGPNHPDTLPGCGTWHSFWRSGEKFLRLWSCIAGLSPVTRREETLRTRSLVPLINAQTQALMVVGLCERGLDDDARGRDHAHARVPVLRDLLEDLAHLPFAVGLSRHTRGIIRQNVFVSLGVVAFLVPATILGLGIGPAVAVHEGSTLLVVVNALRLLAYRDPAGKAA